MSKSLENGNAVELFLLDLAALAPVHAALLALLDAREQARAAAFAVPGAREQFIRARGVLRLLLADRLGIAPRQVAFALSAMGKPSLCGAGAGTLWFNLSHSHGLLALALSRVGEVGIDVEWVDPDADVEALAACAWGAPATRELLQLPQGPPRQRAFFERWVQAEARAKWASTGLKGISVPAYPASAASTSLPEVLFTASTEKQKFIGAVVGFPKGYTRPARWLRLHQVQALLADKATEGRFDPAGRR